jgi:hypothetical protein
MKWSILSSTPLPALQPPNAAPRAAWLSVALRLLPGAVRAAWISPGRCCPAWAASYAPVLRAPDEPWLEASAGSELREWGRRARWSATSRSMRQSRNRYGSPPVRHSCPARRYGIDVCSWCRALRFSCRIEFGIWIIDDSTRVLVLPNSCIFVEADVFLSFSSITFWENFSDFPPFYSSHCLPEISASLATSA